MKDSILVVEGLRTQFRSAARTVEAVRGVSFQLGRGEILGIVGESGSGKSTLLMSILRLLPPKGVIAEGSIRFDGRELLSLSKEEMRRLRGSEISLIPQRPMSSLSPVSTISVQLHRFFGAHGSRGQPRTEAIATMLTKVGLRPILERLHSYPHQFSGGQLQRLLIGTAALSARPRVLLADEPTSTLDVTVQAQVLHLLTQLRRDLGVSIIFVTHDLAVVAETCDRVGVMYAGELVEVADVGLLFSDPRHPYTRALLAAVPGRHLRGQRLASIPGTVADLRKLPAGCAFAPRCQSVMDRCRELSPENRVVGASLVRCHLYADEPA